MNKIGVFIQILDRSTKVKVISLKTNKTDRPQTRADEEKMKKHK